jgi:hypothetical protein
VKIYNIYKTNPEIFVQLPLDQQLLILQAAGLEASIRSPLIHFNLYEETEYYDPSYSRVQIHQVQYIDYWNDHYRLQVSL